MKTRNASAIAHLFASERTKPWEAWRSQACPKRQLEMVQSTISFLLTILSNCFSKDCENKKTKGRRKAEERT